MVAHGRPLPVVIMLEWRVRAVDGERQGDSPKVEGSPADNDVMGRGWTDLAGNRPAQAARERADAERAAARERGRVRAFLARAVDAKTDERAWRIGAGREETVRARLDKLSGLGWHVLHAVPVGTRGSDIDHVVIGPGGVFTLDTKTHPGASVWVGGDLVLVNGHRTDYVRSSRFEAGRAERLLPEAVGFPVLVRPALVLLTGTPVPRVTVRKPPDGVLVLDRTDIPRAFRRRPRVLDAGQVAAVFAQARRSTTWCRTGSGPAGRRRRTSSPPAPPRPAARA